MPCFKDDGHKLQHSSLKILISKDDEYKSVYSSLRSALFEDNGHKLQHSSLKTLISKDDEYKRVYSSLRSALFEDNGHKLQHSSLKMACFKDERFLRGPPRQDECFGGFQEVILLLVSLRARRGNHRRVNG